MQDGGPDYIPEILVAWDTRLRAASDVNAGFVLPGEAAAAVMDLMASLEHLDREDALEWLDLFPRNVLELVDIQPVALEPTVHRASAAGLDNGSAPAQDWNVSKRPARLALASAA